MTDAKFATLNDLFATYAGSRAGLQPWLKDAEINRDKDLRLQYLAGLALNHSEENTILKGVMQYWMPPIELFSGSPQRLDALFTAMVSQIQPAESPKSGSTAAPASGARPPSPAAK